MPAEKAVLAVRYGHRVTSYAEMYLNYHLYGEPDADLGIDAIKRVAPDHVDNVRKHFIDRLTPRQLEEVRDAFGPIVDYLRKIRDRD